MEIDGAVETPAGQRETHKLDFLRAALLTERSVQVHAEVVASRSGDETGRVDARQCGDADRRRGPAFEELEQRFDACWLVAMQTCRERDLRTGCGAGRELEERKRVTRAPHHIEHYDVCSAVATQALDPPNDLRISPDCDDARHTTALQRAGEAFIPGGSLIL